MKKFDLNIEKILENWEIYHGIREIIANALDEQKITKTSDIKIFKDDNNNWHIRDFGRGITIEHFTEKENEEKLNADGIIGKFGIGLKDALATFDRKNVNVKIISKYGEFTIGKSIKTGFDDIITLHIYINPSPDPAFIGTEFILSKIAESDIQKAKNMFLNFSGEKEIESCIYGMVLDKKYDLGRIYINGVKVADEENFLFSYNITSLNAAIRKALNRERTNVGRTAYANTIKSILLNCKGRDVATALVNDFKNFSTGTMHDELKWIDVQEHAVKMLNNYEKVVFVTTDEIASSPDLIEEVKNGGFAMVNIPANLKEKIQGQSDVGGNVIREFNQFKIERNENFEFKFVQIEKLNQLEKQNYNLLDQILGMIGGKPSIVHKILISETMQRDDDSFSPADGLWQGDQNQIIIKRSVLSDSKRFVAILLHEIAHAKSGATDATRAFESELTSMLGIIGLKAIKKQQMGNGIVSKIDPSLLGDYAIVGAGHIQDGIIKFADWSKKMLVEFPELQGDLQKIWDHIKENFKGLIPEEKPAKGELPKTEESKSTEEGNTLGLKNAITVLDIKNSGQPLSMEDVKNYGIIGAWHVQNGIHEFKNWSKKMLEEYPDIKDNLKEIWQHVWENYKELFVKSEKAVLPNVERGKQTKNELNITPEDLKVISKRGFYHMESGIRTFKDWTNKMVKEIGDEIKPYLKEMYDHINVNYTTIKEEYKIQLDKTNNSQNYRSKEEIDASIKLNTAKLIAALTHPNANNLSGKRK